MLRGTSILAAALLVAGVAASVSSAAGGGRLSATPTTITVTAGKPTEYAFTLSSTTVPLGIVVFKIVNAGKVAHDFKIAGKKSPLLAPGKKAKLSIVFAQAGSFKFSSSISAQSAKGMHGVLAVGPKPKTSTTSSAPAAPAPAEGSYGGGTTVGGPCANPVSTTVSVKIFEFGFTITPSTVPCGTVTFNITNTGFIAHNFDIESIASNGQPGFNGGLILLGNETTTETITYMVTGTFAYHCDLHYDQGLMLGSLKIV